MVKTLFGTITGSFALSCLNKLGAASPQRTLEWPAHMIPGAGDCMRPATPDTAGNTQSTDPAVQGAEKDKKDYAAFLTALGLVHLRTSEILAPHFKVRGKIHNTLPPRELWPKMVATLRIADKLRPIVDAPLTAVVSAYRSPAYNAACSGSATRSCHMENHALDLQFACAPSKVADAAVWLRGKGEFKGGVGRYPGFTHVDTRGYNADW